MQQQQQQWRVRQNDYYNTAVSVLRHYKLLSYSAISLGIVLWVYIFMRANYMKEAMLPVHALSASSSAVIHVTAQDVYVSLFATLVVLPLIMVILIVGVVLEITVGVEAF